ncbi:MAG: YkgJ family cysteine cluster protein [Pyrinomonadaceae bacterium]|nr:YkgJ family cysteine cluster protein [Pyrinomonadaceae bacterium]
MEKTDFVQITRQPTIPENEFYPMIYKMYEEIWFTRLPPEIPTKLLTVKRAKNVVTPPDAPIPDCITCGLCCEMMPCVGVRPHEDIAPEDYWDITVEGKNGEIVVDRYLRRNGETFACQQLTNDNGKILCKIYETRPQMCRDFDAGSDKCHALRRISGLEPYLPRKETVAALEKLEARPQRGESSEMIDSVKFVETDAGTLDIVASLKDESKKTIYNFDPKLETWRQFEFDALTLEEAAQLVENRRQMQKNK